MLVVRKFTLGYWFPLAAEAFGTYAQALCSLRAKLIQFLAIVQVLLDVARRVHGAKVVRASIAVENVASRRLVEGLGFKSGHWSDRG
jgi:hypothetical protein